MFENELNLLWDIKNGNNLTKHRYIHVQQAEFVTKFNEEVKTHLKNYEKFVTENGHAGHFVGDSVGSMYTNLLHYLNFCNYDQNKYFVFFMHSVPIVTVVVVVQLTVADIMFAAAIDRIDGVLQDPQLNEYPKLKEVIENVRSNPGIAAWIAKRPVTM